MRNKIFFINPIILLSVFLFLLSCNTPKGLVFSEFEWHISSHYGQIIDKDTIYRMTFGNVLIPDPLVIISSKDSLVKYPGMDKFLKDILHTTRLDSAEILFYTPEMQTMFVKPKSNLSNLKPSSISFDLSEEKPGTMWIYEKDFEKWIRKPDEMYTYTYFNKGKKQLLIVDFYDYGNEPIAQITIFQNRSKSSEKMNLPKETIRSAFFVNPDLSKYMHHIEPLANWVDYRRENAFSNYKIGREQKLRIKGVNLSQSFEKR